MRGVCPESMGRMPKCEHLEGKDGVKEMFGAIRADKPFGRLMIWLLDMLTLNVLFLVTSLPIITIGASTSAMYQVTMAMAGKRSKEPNKEYILAFRENFAKITPIWLLFLVYFLVLLFDLWLNYAGLSVHVGLFGREQKVRYAVLFIGTILMLTYVDWVFAMQARFVNGRKVILKNAFMFFVRYGLVSLVLCAAGLVFAVFTWTQPYFWPVALWLGFSFPAFVKGKYFEWVFAPYVAEIKKGERQ